MRAISAKSSALAPYLLWMVLDFCEVAVVMPNLLFHVLASCVAEELCGARSVGHATRFFQD